VAHRLHGARLPALDTRARALGQQQVDDLLARVIAEELALVLLVPRDAVALHQIDELLRRVARQRRAAEVGVGRRELSRRGVAVGEVAASAAGDADLFGHRGRMVDQHHAHAALARDRRTMQAGRTGADDDCVCVAHRGAS
jgi:hypothetical protein